MTGDLADTDGTAPDEFAVSKPPGATVSDAALRLARIAGAVDALRAALGGVNNEVNAALTALLAEGARSGVAVSARPVDGAVSARPVDMRAAQQRAARVEAQEKAAVAEMNAAFAADARGEWPPPPVDAAAAGGRAGGGVVDRSSLEWVMRHNAQSDALAGELRRIAAAQQPRPAWVQGAEADIAGPPPPCDSAEAQAAASLMIYRGVPAADMYCAQAAGRLARGGAPGAWSVYWRQMSPDGRVAYGPGIARALAERERREVTARQGDAREMSQPLAPSLPMGDSAAADAPARYAGPNYSPAPRDDLDEWTRDALVRPRCVIDIPGTRTQGRLAGEVVVAVPGLVIAAARAMMRPDGGFGDLHYVWRSYWSAFARTMEHPAHLWLYFKRRFASNLAVLQSSPLPPRRTDLDDRRWVAARLEMASAVTVGQPVPGAVVLQPLRGRGDGVGDGAPLSSQATDIVDDAADAGSAEPATEPVAGLSAPVAAGPLSPAVPVREYPATPGVAAVDPDETAPLSAAPPAADGAVQSGAAPAALLPPSPQPAPADSGVDSPQAVDRAEFAPVCAGSDPDRRKAAHETSSPAAPVGHGGRRRWLTPDRERLFRAMWLAGNNRHDIKAALSAMLGPELPSVDGLSETARALGWRRPEHTEPQVRRVTDRVERPQPPRMAGSVQGRRGPSDQSHGLRAVKPVAVKPRPVDVPVAVAVPKERWTAARDGMLRNDYETGGSLHQMLAFLNRMPGAPITHAEMVARAVALGLLRRPVRAVAAEVSGSGSIDVGWAEVAEWCEARGFRFDGGMERVNAIRERAGMRRWCLVEPFGPGSTPSSMAAPDVAGG